MATARYSFGATVIPESNKIIVCGGKGVDHEIMDSCELFERIRDLPRAALLDSSYPHATSARYDVLTAQPWTTKSTVSVPPPSPPAIPSGIT